MRLNATAASIVVLATSCATVSRADPTDLALNCFESVDFEDREAWQACLAEFNSTCWAKGRDVTDKAPQTDCMNALTEKVDARAALLIRHGSAPNANVKDHITAAALVRAFAVGTAECVFHDAIGIRRGATEADRAFADAMCRASYWSEAYWRIIVNGHVK